MDWKVVIRELRESGMTLAQIAAACPDDSGKTPGVSTISELGTGKSDEPGHGLGQRLLTLHRTHVKQAKRKGKAVSEHAQADADREHPTPDLIIRGDGTVTSNERVDNGLAERIPAALGNRQQDRVRRQIERERGGA